MIKLNIEKSANKNYVLLRTCNKIKYFVKITNIGDSKAKSVRIKDYLSCGAGYISGTFEMNGHFQKVSEIDKFVCIGSIKPGASVVISYEVEIKEHNTPSYIYNRALVSYCDEFNFEYNASSEELTIPVIKIEVEAYKSVDKITANEGDILNYAVVIKNNSNVPIKNIIFYDELDKNLELVPNSVLINSQVQPIEDFNNGINLGDLNAYSSLIIRFQAKIKPIESTVRIWNQARIEFIYLVNDGGIIATSFGETCTNKVSTNARAKKKVI